MILSRRHFFLIFSLAFLVVSCADDDEGGDSSYVPPPPCEDDELEDGTIARCGNGLDIIYQEQVNDLSNVSVIKGDLLLRGYDITNLSPLGKLRHVEGNFGLAGLGELESLDGLSSLTRVDGVLSIFEDEKLVDLEALFSLNYAGALIVGLNGPLTQLTGFSSLKTVGVGGMLIVGNNELTDISAFEALEEIQGGLTLTSFQLRSFAFPSLRKVSDLEVTSNPSIEHLDGFASLEEITGDLKISKNRVLADLRGLSALKVLGRKLYINGESLPTCEAEWLRDNIDDFDVSRSNDFAYTLAGDLCEDD